MIGSQSSSGDSRDSEQAPLPTRTHTDDGRPILLHVRALYDYTATIDQEFDFRAGDVIAVTDTPQDGWWRGELVDETRRRPGRDVFPSNYVSSTSALRGTGTGAGAVPPASLNSGSEEPVLNSIRTYTDDGRPILFYAKALYDYAATIDDEFDFKAGDLIAVTDTPEHGWWRGELADPARRRPGTREFPSNYVSVRETGRCQWEPRAQAQAATPPPPPTTKEYTDDGRRILFHVKALYDYSATIDEEFDFQEGDVIAVTDAPEDGWWIGELADETRREAGRDVFPSNFVRML